MIEPRWIVFFLSLGVFALSARWMQLLATGLHPRIIDLELAGNRDDVRLLLRSWSGEERSRARKIIAVDFLFLIAYGAGGAALALLLGEFAAHHGWWLARWSGTVAVFFLVAAFLDALENLLALLMTVRDDPGHFLPGATAFLATWKFILAGAALLYFLVLLLRAEVAVIQFLVRMVWPGA